MKRRKNNVTTKQCVLIFLILFVLLYTLIYVLPTVSDIFTQTYIAEYGTLEERYEVDCLLVRDETLYKAGNSGKVERVAEDGELMMANRHIVTVGSTEVYSDEIGIVSYYYDGYEGKLNSDGIEKLTEEFFSEYKSSAGMQKAAEKNAEAGDVVFKIVDRTKWYVVFWVEEDEAETFVLGTSVTAIFDEEDDVKMTVSALNKQGKQYQVVLSTDRIYKDFDKLRTTKCAILANSNSGIILKTDSIVEKDGVKGVYVIDKYGKENFTPIQIYSCIGDSTVVAKNYFYDSEGYPVETVKNYDEILKKGK